MNSESDASVYMFGFCTGYKSETVVSILDHNLIFSSVL